MAVDPSYPLYPILCIGSAFFMFLILTHSFICQTWNLAVTFLCIGLFLDNLTHGINAVVWRDNADIKAHVYCDIVSRLQFFMNFLPITSLLITRKLYIVSTMRDVDAPSRKVKLLDLVIEWGWGLGYPLFMTVVIFFYCPLIIRTVYIQSQSTNLVLQSNGSMSRTFSVFDMFPIFSANAPNSDIERNTDWADSYIYVSPPLNIADFYLTQKLNLFSNDNKAADNLTLHDIENSLSELLASMFWTLGHLPAIHGNIVTCGNVTCMNNSTDPFTLLRGSAIVTEIITQVHLDLSIIAIAVGLGSVHGASAPVTSDIGFPQRQQI
ncbi:pheromone A receptor-domain-containing protein [Mycena rebaudengoi]|nr:pheromone A receptor-domain-containing protein [Mycena rebaudengoi]